MHNVEVKLLCIPRVCVRVHALKVCVCLSSFPSFECVFFQAFLESWVCFEFRVVKRVPHDPMHIHQKMFNARSTIPLTQKDI